jgi:hypothetical protein
MELTMARRSIRILVAAVVAAAHGITNLAVSQAAVPAPEPMPDTQERLNQVLQTINRISGDNPTAYLRVQVAQEAGRSQLAATLVQAVSRARTPQEVAVLVQQALAGIGGLSTGNVISLAELLEALRAMGLSEDHINAALSAYSVEVAEAAATGAVDPVVAAAIMAQDQDASLYG